MWSTWNRNKLRKLAYPWRHQPVIVLSSLLFLLFIHGVSRYLCVVSLIGVSLSLQSPALFPIFLDISMTQAILPIRRPLSWGNGVLWSPISIGRGVELVILEMGNNNTKSNQAADRGVSEQWSEYGWVQFTWRTFWAIVTCTCTYINGLCTYKKIWKHNFFLGLAYRLP